MYLSRVEIFGFKSFAQKLVLELGPGITAVVGPNGCGKTNISDAVRWALGEHNIRTLRGRLLEDVIFNGSPKREPLGMAEVTLTFSGAAGFLPLGVDEVSITRRVFRSGESEFILNGVPCRLKEITDQLMDRGLGHRSYAIIERELVDRVLEDTSRERRALIEEAAGIARYKSREKAARRKLDLTEQDLLRLQDIVSEVEKRVDSLQRQVGKAKRYQEYEVELKDAEMLLAVSQLRALEERRSRLAEERHGAELFGEGVRAELRTLETRRETLRVHREEADRELSQAEAVVAEVARRATEIEGRIQLLRERQRALLEQAGRAREESAHHAARRAELARRHEEGLAERALCQTEAVALAERLQARREGLARLEESASRHATALEERRAASMQALERRVARSKELEAAQRELEGVAQQGQELERQWQQLETERAWVREERGGRAAALQRLGEAFERAETGRLRARQRLAEMEEERTQREERERELAGELAALESHLTVLKELDERLEGFSRSVRDVMQEARAGGSVPGKVRGVVGELLATGEDRVSAALEAALAHGLDCVVTEDLAGAHELVQFLRAGRRGRATFLPLQTLRAANGSLAGGKGVHGGVPDALRRQSGVLGHALDFVVCQDDVRPIARFLLGDTVITESLEVAERLAARSEFAHVRFVTLAGETFRHPGVVTGGSAPEGEASPFNRGRRIEGMGRRVEEARVRQREAAALRERASEELSALRRTLEELEAEIDACRRADQEERVELHRLEGVLAGQQHRAEVLENERARIAADLERARAAVEATTADHSRLEESDRAATSELTRAEAEARRLAAAREEVQEDLHRTELELTTRRGRLASLAEELPRLLAEGEMMAQNETRQRELVGDASRQAEALAGEISAEESRHREVAGEVEERGARRDDAARRVGEIGETERAADHEAAAKREALHEAGEAVHRLELAEREIAVEAENLRRQRPDLDFTREPVGEDGVSRLVTEEEELAALRARVEDLHDRIRRLGPVNFVALEEFDTERDRYDFLKGQRDDLVQSRDSLLEAAKRINRTARQRFVETFEVVRQNFRDTFTLLFDEGEASLTLPEGMDPLECPIDIMARPRGKSLREVSLLSGGERALSAIALLVALYRVKPSPFCLMDEVDAPLDDSNVLRFSSMLRRLTENTQFVVITHNKRTMEVADVLYGVTMAETGVSTVLSVKLEEAHQWAQEPENGQAVAVGA